jgi:hypothetical protein
VRSTNTQSATVSRATVAPAKPASAIEQQSVRAAKPQSDGADESDRVIDWLLQQRRR